MKKIRIFAFVLAVVMLAAFATACGGNGNSTKVTVNAKVSVIVNDELMLDSIPVTVTGTTENPPTVLEAGQTAFIACDVPYVIDESGLRISSLTFDGVEYTNKSDESYAYTWLYTADGAEPQKGRAGNNAVLEGQSIVFTYTAIPFEQVEFSSGEEDAGE